MARKPEMVGEKPKFRMVKAKKRRGIRALGRPRAIGGMERQILNPATGKYVTYLGPKQEMRLYSPKALAKIEKREGARKLKKAAAKKKAADESGLTATREKGEEILRQKKAGTYKPKKVDQKLIDKFNQSALGKSGDGKVSFDPSTGKYTLDAFGAKKTYSADEFAKAIAKKKKAPKPPKPPKTATQPTAKVADQKLLDQFSKTALGKSGDGKVSFDEKTGKYVLDAFGAKKSFTPDEFKKQIVGKKETPKAEPKAPAKVAKGKIEKRRPTRGEPETPTRVDTTPKPKAPAKAKVAARPRSREDVQIDIPEVINVPGIGEIRLSSTTPAAPKAEVKAKPKKEVKTPKKGRIREREDIRVDTPTREDIDKIIKDLDIKIPKVIDIPGAGQVTIPTAPKPPVDTPKEKSQEALDALERIDKGGITGGVPFDSGPPRPAGNRLKSDDPFFSSPEFEAIKGKPGTMDMYTASDGTEFGSGSTGRAYERYLNRIKEEVSAPTPPSGVGREPAPDLPPAPPPVVRPPMPPPPSDVMPGEVFMDQPGQRPPGDPVSAPTPPPQPRLVSVDPFKGFQDAYRPINIVGQSFDPSVRDDYERQMQETRARMMQPGGNIRASEYPTYQMPTLAVPQTQFGGYGQPMPIAPLLPYAGLASATMPEQVERRREPASGARVNPGTGEIEPVGIAPDPRLLNLPPGVSGPIR